MIIVLDVHTLNGVHTSIVHSSYICIYVDEKRKEREKKTITILYVREIIYSIKWDASFCWMFNIIISSEKIVFLTCLELILL